MLAQMKLQLHFYPWGVNNQLKHARKNIIELAAASGSCLSQLLCCPLLLLHWLRCKLKSCPAAPGSYTHTEFTRGSSLTRTEFLISRCARPLVLAVVQSGGRPQEGNKWQQSLIHSEATWLQRFHRGRWREDHDCGQSGSPKSQTRSVVSVRVRRQSEMEKVKAFIQRQRKSTFSHLYQLRKLSPAECRQSREKYGTHWNILSRLQRN